MDRNTGEMTGVVTATASPDGQAVTQGFPGLSTGITAFMDIAPPSLRWVRYDPAVSVVIAISCKFSELPADVPLADWKLREAIQAT